MTKYLIDFEEFEENDFYEELEDVVNNWVEEGFDDMLDNDYPTCQIGCCTFYPSQIMKECDPIAYNCAIDDYQDMEISNAKYELEHSGEVDINGKLFQIVEEEDEEDE